MNEKEIRKMIGNDNWPQFCDFMVGKRVRSYPNGDVFFFDEDVKDFKRYLFMVGTICGAGNVERKRSISKKLGMFMYTLKNMFAKKDTLRLKR